MQMTINFIKIYVDDDTIFATSKVFYIILYLFSQIEEVRIRYFFIFIYYELTLSHRNQDFKRCNSKKSRKWCGKKLFVRPTISGNENYFKFILLLKYIA